MHQTRPNFHRITLSAFGQTRHSRMKFRTRIGSPHGNDFRFPFCGRVLHAQVEAAPAKRIADSPFFVRCEYDERNALCLDRSELGNAELPYA
jgi:hypothetical protein